ncbi:hypothetical protein GIB67_023395 [Kingdonia uniflora]|uniref:General transcription factor 3C polypeptide 5 n=1 Tax=Kingdonia uniflora TaxID=39325 RepID=A0A7J7LIM8_9MAGN|nr:hypothetical protein GIB67_023395 [Kingdonia uniflora]
MGVVEEGSVSGVLPEQEVFAVHYPGYPSSISRAVATLGGTAKISETRTSQLRLELHFRPEDPYSHPAFGELRPCNSLLLKISKKKKSTSDQDVLVSESVLRKCPSIDRNNEEHPLQDVKVSAEIVARVSEAYQFNGMVDYQHVVAVHADVAKRKRHRAEVEPHLGKGGLMEIDEEDLMVLVPQLFSPKDSPAKIALTSSPAVGSNKKGAAVVQQRWEMDIEPCLAIDFDIKEIPRMINWEDIKTPGIAHWESQRAVAKLFDERPIWPNRSLSARLLDGGLKFSTHLLKRLLFRTAYYFSTGPFRQFWILKGYDPRKDPGSRMYQSVDFRVPLPLRKFRDVNPTEELKRIWKDLCAFHIFPCQSQTSFQLFDLVDDYIQEEIRKPSQRTSCSCKTGWFSSHELDILRLRVSVRFLSICPQVGAVDLLKTTSQRFEKFKRMHALKKDLRDEEEHRHINKGSSGNASRVSKELVHGDDKNESDEDDTYNDGCDEIEVEEDEEEELDEYESLHEAGNDVDFSLQPSSHTSGENISKNYLQELFGSFPFTEAGNNLAQNTDCSDGEYQIFDNFNFSDDDDDDEC